MRKQWQILFYPSHLDSLIEENTTQRVLVWCEGVDTRWCLGLTLARTFPETCYSSSDIPDGAAAVKGPFKSIHSCVIADWLYLSRLCLEYSYWLEPHNNCTVCIWQLNIILNDDICKNHLQLSSTATRWVLHRDWAESEIHNQRYWRLINDIVLAYHQSFGIVTD